jgi:hypothetical protein
MYIAWDHINTNCILIFSMCFACTPYSSVLILRIIAYLRIKGGHFILYLRNFYGGHFTCKLVYYNLYFGYKFVSECVQIYAILYVSNLYVLNLY